MRECKRSAGPCNVLHLTISQHGEPLREIWKVYAEALTGSDKRNSIHFD